MARRSKRPIADRTYQVLEQVDLTGGMDLRRSPSNIGETRARNIVNFSLNEPGALKVRPGYQAWSTTNLGASPGQGGQRVYLGSTSFTLYAWNGGLYTPTDTGGLSTTPVLSGLSATEPIYLTYDRNLVGVFDSTSTPKKSTDGQTWTRLGIAASTASPGLSTASTGSLSTSTFEVAYTYKDRGLAFEGNGSDTRSVAVSDTGTGLVVTVSNSTDPQVDAVVLYARNVTAGETVLRKVSSAAMSTGANSTYVIDSSAWSANAEIPTRHTPAPVLKFGVNWKNRWWAADATVGNRLCFTELFLPQAWYALYYIDIPFECGDKIEAIVPSGDVLVVFGGTRTYLVIGQTSLDFEVRGAAGAQSGALGPKAAIPLEQGVIHCATDGVFLFDGATDRLLSYDIEPGWKDLVQNVPSTGLARVEAIYDYGLKELRIAVPRRYPTGDRGEWVMDLNRSRDGEPAWTATDRTVVGYIHWDGDEDAAGQRGTLLSFSTNGTLWQENSGQTANSSNLTAEFEGPTFSIGLHRARFVDLHTEYEPNDGAYTVEVLTDQQSQGQLGITIGAGRALYASTTALYGTALYGSLGRRKGHTFLPLGAEGRTVTTKLAYSGKAAFRVFTYALGMVPESRPRAWTE